MENLMENFITEFQNGMGYEFLCDCELSREQLLRIAKELVISIYGVDKATQDEIIENTCCELEDFI